ncbi:MAG: hypothetical protein Q7S83_03940 [bacterium]|nr:hypothetical protein [bacterium]
MRSLIPPLMLCSVFFVSGCTTTKTETKMTGLFDNDAEKMIAAYDLVEKDKTTLAQLTEIGFNPKAPNVSTLDGPEAMRAIFGEQAFDTALRDRKNIRELLDELSHYSMIEVPYFYLEEKEDRFYFSTQDTFRDGKEARLRFVLYDGVVIYGDKKHVIIKGHESESAFAEGLFKLVEKFGGAAGKINDLLKKVLGK